MSLADALPLADCPPGYLAGWLGLVLFWGVENFFVQAFLFDLPPITKHPRYYQMMRLAIDLTVCAMVLLVFNRTCLVVLASANFLFSVLVVAHAQYFRRAWSLCHGIKHFREGLKTWSFAFQLVPTGAWLSLFCALVIKLCWILLITPAPPQFQQNGWALGVLLALAFAELVILQFTSFRFASIRLTSITRTVYAYGYLNSWIAELFIAPDARQVVKELAELQKVSPDRLAETEEPWPVSDRIALVQLESVGWNALNCRMNGQEVTPYMNRLARASRLLRLRAYHNIGTADMDYAAMSCGTPSPNLISYFVPEIDYSGALPRFMQEHGFRTVSLHGATGEFYNRRSNFERMGFDEIHFREEFRGQPVAQSYWGVRDQELFRVSAEKMRKASGPEFHFIITLDSHGPFNLIQEKEKEVFPGSGVWQENYFNSLRVLDHVIEEYVESLPAGTLVIFYGDHTAGVHYGDFHPSREGDNEYVPCLVHACKVDPAWRSESSGGPALPADLRILDVVNFLKSQIDAARPAGKGALLAGR